MAIKQSTMFGSTRENDREAALMPLVKIWLQWKTTSWPCFLRTTQLTSNHVKLNSRYKDIEVKNLKTAHDMKLGGKKKSIIIMHIVKISLFTPKNMVISSKCKDQSNSCTKLLWFEETPKRFVLHMLFT